MAGIYVHIPFCKQKCHYCDFHFSTNLTRQQEMADAICSELELRKDYLSSQKISTIYFGGGTPSLLIKSQLNQILSQIKKQFEVELNAEITLEANPDDLNESNLQEFKEAGVNRLSIGIQSFEDDVLTLMNRAHNSDEAKSCIQKAHKIGFKNITTDLIYGIPGKDIVYWKEQVGKMLEIGVQHISAYCLTIEQNTVFKHWEQKEELVLPDDDESLEQFNYLIDALKESGFEQYEISNFATKDSISKHNSAYWLGEMYLGVGPSAHSYNIESRSWNVRNNNQYLKAIQAGKLSLESEELSANDKFNDYILTRLRTKWGLNKIDLAALEKTVFHKDFSRVLKSHISDGFLSETKDAFVLTHQGKFIADRLAADLFV